MRDLVIISKDELREIIEDVMIDLMPAAASTYPLNTPGMHPTITSTEAAAILNVTPFTVRQWAVSGRIPYSRVGKKYLFNRNEMLKLAHSRRQSEQ